MSRKHFEAIAAILKINDWQESVEDMRESIALDIAAYFKGENPRFDKDKFLKACGLEDV